MEKKEPMETNEASPRDIENVEEKSFTVQSEEDWGKHSIRPKYQTVGRDSHEFGNEQDNLLDNVTSQAIRKLEGDIFTVQSEDQNKESKEMIDIDLSSHDEIKDDVTEAYPLAQRLGHNSDLQCESQQVKFDNEQNNMSHKINEVIDIDSSSHDEIKDNVTEAYPLAQRVGHGSDLQCESQQEKFDNEQDNMSDKINEMIDIDLSSHDEIKVNVTRAYQLTQRVGDSYDLQCESQQESLETSIVPDYLFQNEHKNDSVKSNNQVDVVGQEYFGGNVDNKRDFEHRSQEVCLDNNLGCHGLAIEDEASKSMESAQMNQKTKTTSEENNLECGVGGSKIHNTEIGCNTSIHTLDNNIEAPRVVDKAISLRNFVREKSIIAVSIMLRHLSGKRDECDVGNSTNMGKDALDLSTDSETKAVSEKTMEKTTWNPLNFIKMSDDVDVRNKIMQNEEPITEGPPLPIAMKGMIIVYTRLRCQECKEVRKFLYMKRLRYVEINIDVYPSRMKELEKNSKSTSVPKVFFNEILIGGLSKLKSLDESGKLNEKIDYLINEAPSYECPVPPLSGEDDVSSNGALDEMALIVRKMKECIVVKDRFYKMRWFTNCFIGSEAINFLSEDQYLERKEAVVFAQKLASKLFFQHVLDENVFEDGNHLYRFLDDDPAVASLCYNIPRGIITVKPKPITEVASRLRLLSYAMFEAYASEDGRHVDYRNIHGSEEFARYLRTVEELQRGDIWDLSREEKLAFFINLYNMMTIHAILVLGHPSGTLERNKLFGDFKYVIGGSTYSLSAIQNGILRGNQRPPYTLMKPFGAKDKRLRVALPFPEPLIHFALVYGTRSGPALRCYSPADIDNELMDATHSFLKSGGLLIDFAAKVAYASKILKWFSVDFGKNEAEVLKHMSNYLDPADSELLLNLLATSELKVIYQPYDWSLNC